MPVKTEQAASGTSAASYVQSERATLKDNLLVHLLLSYEWPGLQTAGRSPTQLLLYFELTKGKAAATGLSIQTRPSKLFLNYHKQPERLAILRYGDITKLGRFHNFNMDLL